MDLAFSDGLTETYYLGYRFDNSLGKEFKLEKQDNFDGFLKALGSNITEDQMKAILAHKSTVKLTKDRDTYTLTTSRPNNEVSVVSFQLGAEVDDNMCGRPAKSTFTMEGERRFNTLTQVQKFDNGVTFTFKREFLGNEMVATCTSSIWDGVAYRYYRY